MEKLFTVELDQQDKTLEMHLNKVGVEYLKSILEKLILNDQDSHIHLMSPEWGGDELSTDQQNLGDNIMLLHQLKVVYWKE